MAKTRFVQLKYVNLEDTFENNYLGIKVPPSLQIYYFLHSHFNFINLFLKLMILKFDLFTEIAIEVQKYLNTRIYDFNPPNINENYTMRYYSFITNTTIEDKDELRKMFIPTKDELERNHMLNEAARKK